MWILSLFVTTDYKKAIAEFVEMFIKLLIERCFINEIIIIIMLKKKTGHIQGKREKDFIKVFKTHRIH